LNKQKSIIEELDTLLPVKNKHSVIESRAAHVITSAIHLVELIHANYDESVAEDLTKRLAKSIMLKESAKFMRKLSQLKKGAKND
jgi:hypothetical protein